MDVRKLWDNADEKSEYKSVCDVYGAEHLARLIGEFMNNFLGRIKHFPRDTDQTYSLPT
jgi:hypothetical protein